MGGALDAELPFVGRYISPGAALLWRLRLLRQRHASGDPAAGVRKSPLIHRLLALPGRDRPGAPRGPAQLSNPDQRAHRLADRQRLPAG